MLAPDRVVTEVPATVRPPAPEITPVMPEAPEFSVSTEPDDSVIAPGFDEPVLKMLAMLSLPPPVSAKVPSSRIEAFPANAPPSVDSVASGSMVIDAPARLPAPVSARVPPEIVVPPVKVFAPVSVWVPVPTFCRKPVPEITPPNAVLVFALPVTTPPAAPTTTLPVVPDSAPAVRVAFTLVVPPLATSDPTVSAVFTFSVPPETVTAAESDRFDPAFRLTVPAATVVVPDTAPVLVNVPPVLFNEAMVPALLPVAVFVTAPAAPPASTLKVALFVTAPTAPPAVIATVPAFTVVAPL